MAYVRFDDGGYGYFDGGHYLLFSEDNAHKHMFNYVAQDLSCIPELFEQYLSQRINTATFELHGGSDSDIFLDQIKSMLIVAHPYYKYEVRNVLISAIGNYFNDLLLYSCYNRHIANPGFSEEWYIKRIEKLLAPVLELGDTYPKDFYNEYQKRIGGDIYTAGQPESEMETVIYGIPREKPAGLSNEIKTQREVYNMLYFLLDISARGLDELTTPQRVWFYSNIAADSVATVPGPFSFKQSAVYRAGGDYSEVMGYNREVDDIFRPIYALGKLNVGCDGIPAGMESAFCSAIDYTKAVTATQLYERYKISSLYQLLYLEIWSMIRSRTKIRKCRHCGKYFVAATRRIVYCDRVDEAGVPCSAAGYQESFQKKMEDDEPRQIYNRAYKTHHARVRKGTMSKDAFQLWCKEAKLKLAEVREGKLNMDGFQEWLKK